MRRVVIPAQKKGSLSESMKRKNTDNPFNVKDRGDWLRVWAGPGRKKVNTTRKRDS